MCRNKIIAPTLKGILESEDIAVAISPLRKGSTVRCRKRGTVMGL